MRHLLCIISIAILCVATPAAAQWTGFYAGGSIGQLHAKSACDGVSGPGVSCDDKDTAWRVLAGFQMSPYFAVEAGYTDLGEVRASGPGGTVSAEATAMEILGIGTLPVADKLSVYGKFGLYRGEVDGRANTFTVTGTASESNTDLTYGFGMRFDITRQAAIRFEWQRYPDIGGPETGEDDVDVIGIGAIVKF